MFFLMTSLSYLSLLKPSLAEMSTTKVTCFLAAKCHVSSGVVYKIT